MARTVVSRNDLITHGKKTKRIYTSNEVLHKVKIDKPFFARAPNGYGGAAQKITGINLVTVLVAVRLKVILKLSSRINTPRDFLNIFLQK